MKNGTAILLFAAFWATIELWQAFVQPGIVMKIICFAGGVITIGIGLYYGIRRQKE